MKTPSSKTATAPPAVKATPNLLDVVANLPEPSKSRAKTDGKTAILAALRNLKKLAKDAATPFLPAKTAAEKKALASKGILSRSAYVALIDEAIRAVEGTTDLRTLKPIRERVGQGLYYGARVVLTGPVAEAFGPYVGSRKPNGEKGTDWNPSPLSKDAGVFSSRVQSA